MAEEGGPVERVRLPAAACACDEPPMTARPHEEKPNPPRSISCFPYYMFPVVAVPLPPLRSVLALRYSSLRSRMDGSACSLSQCFVCLYLVYVPLPCLTDSL